MGELAVIGSTGGGIELPVLIGRAGATGAWYGQPQRNENKSDANDYHAGYYL
jgi:hypothetical protein